MRILFTGATGVLGMASLPLLTADGHDVTAATRSVDDDTWLNWVGARPARVDLFDHPSVAAAMEGIDTVIHFATAIPAQRKMRRRSSWDMNDRLRASATANLVDAARAAGVSRFIQQSITFVYRDGGDG